MTSPTARVGSRLIEFAALATSEIVFAEVFVWVQTRAKLKVEEVDSARVQDVMPAGTMAADTDAIQAQRFRDDHEVTATTGTVAAR